MGYEAIAQLLRERGYSKFNIMRDLDGLVYSVAVQRPGDRRFAVYTVPRPAPVDPSAWTIAVFLPKLRTDRITADAEPTSQALAR
jgi:hypothetical protein